MLPVSFMAALACRPSSTAPGSRRSVASFHTHCRGVQKSPAQQFGEWAGMHAPPRGTQMMRSAGSRCCHSTCGAAHVASQSYSGASAAGSAQCDEPSDAAAHASSSPNNRPGSSATCTPSADAISDGRSSHT